MKGFCASADKVRGQAGAREQVIEKEGLHFMDSDPETQGANEYQETPDAESQVPCRLPGIAGRSRSTIRRLSWRLGLRRGDSVVSRPLP